MVEVLEDGRTRAALAGTARRGHELVESLLLVTDQAPSEARARLVDAAPEGELELERGDRGLVGALHFPHGPLPVEIRCTSARGYLAEVVRATGASAHVLALEARAAARGDTLDAIAARVTDEAALYAALGLPFLAPELRDDDRLEGDADLVAAGDVRGILHVHTTASDGTADAIAMARAAHAEGFAYVGISDHSEAASYARGLDASRLRAQRAEIEAARAAVPEITILHGIETDIHEDGALDIADDVLVELDFVIASIHSALGLDRERQTQRILRAVRHPLVTVLGHPSGRLLLGRPPIDFDLDAVARAAAEAGAALEINTNAQRLDLCADDLRRAAPHGVTFWIDPDAHEPHAFATVGDGALLARRARVPRAQVVNAAPPEVVFASLRERRARGAARLGLEVRG
jgi:DNA polymerase (family 10)